MASNRTQRLLQWILQRLCRGLIRSLSRLEVRGAGRVPPAGPCLMVFNHLSNFDLPVLYAALPRRDLVGLVAASYRGNPFVKAVVQAHGSLWLRRGAGDRATLERALAVLASGRMVGMSPEGGRSRNAELRRAKPGAAALAIRAGVPVLPVGLTGSEEIHKGWLRGRRPQVTVTFGPVVWLKDGAAGSRKSARTRALEEMMSALAALLPDRYQGVYRDHEGGESLQKEALAS